MGRKLGQHFLTNTAIAKRIVDAAEIQSSDTILEVGPGRGILTQFLVEKAKKVVAVEKDKNLIMFLREKFKNAGNLEVVERDILLCHAGLDPASRKQERVENFIQKNGPRIKCEMTFVFPKKYKIVANLPYYITSRFLRLFLEETKHKPQSMTLMVQKEVAERICAKPPHMNLLSISVQAFGKPKALFQVKPGSFSPPPEVDSVVISIDHISDTFFKKHHIVPKQFFKLPKKAFSQKRKMLRSSIGKSSEVKLPKIITKKRPQELSLEEWIHITKP